jgi:HSP20 family protein
MRQPSSMTLSKNYVTDPVRLFGDIGRLFEEPLNMHGMMFPVQENYWQMKPWTPACDIFETEKEIVLKFELPGVKTEDVKVTIDHQVMTLTGKRPFEEESNRENYRRIERHYGEFMRRFHLPMFIDATKINAEFKYGVLTVTLPKRDEGKPKQIDVKVG